MNEPNVLDTIKPTILEDGRRIFYLDIGKMPVSKAKEYCEERMAEIRGEPYKKDSKFVKFLKWTGLYYYQ